MHNFIYWIGEQVREAGRQTVQCMTFILCTTMQTTSSKRTLDCVHSDWLSWNDEIWSEVYLKLEIDKLYWQIELQSKKIMISFNNSFCAENIITIDKKKTMWPKESDCDCFRDDQERGKRTGEIVWIRHWLFDIEFFSTNSSIKDDTIDDDFAGKKQTKMV